MAQTFKSTAQQYSQKTVSNVQLQYTSKPILHTAKSRSLVRPVLCKFDFYTRFVFPSHYTQKEVKLWHKTDVNIGMVMYWVFLTDGDSDIVFSVAKIPTFIKYVIEY